jgi:hypothetical protein
LTPPDDSLPEMERLLRNHHDPLALDAHTAERLVAGSLGAADAPPEYRTVANTLRALRQPADVNELSGESAAVERIAVTIAAQTASEATRRSRVFRVRAATLAATALLSTLGLTGGFAMAGALPGPAQHVASTLLDKVGISAPSGEGHKGNQPSQHSNSSDQQPGGRRPTEPPATAVPPPATAVQPPPSRSTRNGTDAGAPNSPSADNGRGAASPHDSKPTRSPNSPSRGGIGTGDTPGAGHNHNNASDSNLKQQHRRRP